MMSLIMALQKTKWQNAAVKIDLVTLSVASVDSPYTEVLGSHLASRSVDILNDNTTQCKKPVDRVMVISPVSSHSSSCQIEF